MVNSSLTLQKLQIYDWVTCCFNKFCIVGMELVQALQRKDLTFFVTFNYHRFDQNFFVPAVFEDEVASLLLDSQCKLYPDLTVYKPL